MPPVIDQKACTNCEFCVTSCPLDILFMEGEQLVVRYPEECWHCGACRQDCPTGGITFEFPLRMLAG
ncbi:MAG: ferredoxin family protein [bacterium]